MYVCMQENSQSMQSVIQNVAVIEIGFHNTRKHTLYVRRSCSIP